MRFMHWTPRQSPTTATFISDLHLFSGRSNFDVHRAAIEDAIRDSDMCVWGGDLFDFRWTRLADEATTLVQSIDWLERWLSQYPEKQFVFLSGNHDAHQSLARAVTHLSKSHSNFWSDLDVIRIENTLLLHGDLIEGVGTRESLAAYRLSWERKPVATPIQNHIYDAAVAVRFHKAAASAAHRHRGTCRKLWRCVARELGEEVSGVRRVVFGHTHRQIRGLRIDDIDFYNTGATVRHVSFAPVRLSFPAH